jgi:endonuclease/exonuclease/phosphatase family metal-dependent hydrolase
MLIRSWNLYHGNTRPMGRRSYLEEMVQLASADGPDVVLLQEVPAWALARLGSWSGMHAVGDVAQPPRLGPLPLPAEAGRRLTALAPGLLRSAFSGQGNAILLGGRLRPAAHDVLVLNPPGFRREAAQRLGLDLVARLAWAKERRICQVIRIERKEASPLVVANLHATSSPGDARIPAAELPRAAAWVEAFAQSDEVVVLGGDFNVSGNDARLAGFSDPGPGIDHLIVRGGLPGPVSVWPDERRRQDGMLLSDHAPIELEIP